MIYLALVRVCQCEICGGIFHLPGGEYVVDRCVHCGSAEWQYGVQATDGVRVRTGNAHKEVTVNPGAKSLNRRERARKQWRQLKPKPLDEKAEAGDD